jgi:hydroxymethylbilane synthase
VDGVILAAAGLKRLGLFDEHVSALPLDYCLPQAGQGILALETRAQDTATIELLRAIHDADAGACLLAERAVLAALAAGCQAPVAAYAEITGDLLRVRGLVAHTTPRRPLTAMREGSLQNAEHLGHAVAAQLLAQGADVWLREAREATA